MKRTFVFLAVLLIATGFASLYAVDGPEQFASLLKRAQAGDAKAQYNLGAAYAYGKGVAEDLEEAVKWWRKAAEQGDAMAQTNLGSMYANGLGVAKDEAEAVKWYRKAAEQGNAHAKENLKKLGVE